MSIPIAFDDMADGDCLAVNLKCGRRTYVGKFLEFAKQNGQCCIVLETEGGAIFRIPTRQVLNACLLTGASRW